MTRSGDFLDLGNFLKSLATANLPKSPIFLGNFCKGVKIYHFLVQSFLGNFYRRLAIFFWSHCFRCKANRSAVRYDFTTRVTPYPEGRCLWLSWQSGRFRYLRSMVRIQTSAKFYIEHIYCKLLKRQNKAKRGRKWLILKKLYTLIK